MTNELYKKYRPQTLDDMVGQDEVVEMVNAMLAKKRIPHCILASGPSGCGKTTIFRILRTELECSELDFKEINAADFRGIDVVRDIRQSIGLSPINGKCKIWLMDESHQLSAPAQESLLKMLEDTPSHVYFFLASTDPQKLKKTIITRSTHLHLKSLTTGDLLGLIGSVFKKERKTKLSPNIQKKIADLAEGSARKALVLLHQIIDLDLDDEESIINSLESTSTERQAIEICRALLNPRTDWSAMAKILKEVTDDPEQIRWMILGYMKNCALSGSKISGRACDIIELFRDNFFDSKHAGLVASCYAAIGGK